MKTRRSSPRGAKVLHHFSPRGVKSISAHVTRCWAPRNSHLLSPLVKFSTRLASFFLLELGPPCASCCSFLAFAVVPFAFILWVAFGMALDVGVEELVDLLVAVLAEQAAGHSLASHPQLLARNPRLASAPVADARVAALPLLLRQRAQDSTLTASLMMRLS